jgi:hypothetical protein
LSDGTSFTSLSDGSSFTASTEELSFGKGDVNFSSGGDSAMNLNVTEGSVTLSSDQVKFKGISVQDGGR